MNEEAMNPTPETPETTDSFLDGWDDTGTESTPADQPESSNPEPETGGQPEETNAQPQQASDTEPAGAQMEVPPAEQPPAEQAAQDTRPPADVPKVWTLHHLDETRTVNEQEMTALAQKGLDYDRIRGKYDESKPVMETFGQIARQSGMSVPEYLGYLRSQIKQSQGLSEEEARRAVELEDREAAVAVREAEEAQRTADQQQAAQQQNAADARRQADILEFQRTFPDAAKDPQSIPPEVWNGVREGLSLVASYARWQVGQANAAAEQARQQAATASQNQKNADRATGSMRSAGEERKISDAFLEGWGD